VNLPRSSAIATTLVVMFVAFGIGIALVVLLPSGFPQRVLALAAGCGLAFGMVTAAGRLAQRLGPQPPAVVDLDDVAVSVEPVRSSAVLLRELTGPTADDDGAEAAPNAPVRSQASPRPTAASTPPAGRRAGLSSAAAAGSRHPRG
jgi:hypothetical protein